MTRRVRTFPGVLFSLLLLGAANHCFVEHLVSGFLSLAFGISPIADGGCLENFVPEPTHEQDSHAHGQPHLLPALTPERGTLESFEILPLQGSFLLPIFLLASALSLAPPRVRRIRKLEKEFRLQASRRTRSLLAAPQAPPFRI